MIKTGWGIDAFGITPVGQAAIVNPASCSLTDQYMADLSLSVGYKTYYAAALTAFSLQKKIYVIVSNTQCSQSRPMIIGIDLIQ